MSAVVSAVGGGRGRHYKILPGRQITRGWPWPGITNSSALYFKFTVYEYVGKIFGIVARTYINFSRFLPFVVSISRE